MQITQCQPQYNSNKINVVIPSQMTASATTQPTGWKENNVEL